MKRLKGDSMHDPFSRFLDALLKVPINFILKDFVCIDMFCEIYESGLSSLPKRLKPHNLDQVLDWIKVIEGARITYAQNVVSQNEDSRCLIEEHQNMIHKNEKSVSKNEDMC